MRRLLRILFNIATVLSLLLCVAVCVLWIRSYWVGEAVYREGRAYRLAVLSSTGQCSAFRTTYPESADNGPSRWRYSNRGMWAEVTRRPDLYRADPNVRCYGPIAGFGFFDKPVGPPGMGTREVFVPYWFIALLTAAGPAAWWHHARRARSRSLGLCPTCGYDLRATPDRCPECGTIPA